MLSTLIVTLLAQAPPPKPPAPPPQPPPSTSDVRPSGSASQDYRIGPGALLQVPVHDDLNHRVVVQPDGTFVFPLVGAVAAAEATPAEVEAKIVGRLSKGLIRDPQVSVTVQEYRSKVVYVVGEVSRPGTYPLGGAARVRGILARAGPRSPRRRAALVLGRFQMPRARPLLPPPPTP